jgi:hypothetical protein
MTFRHYFDYAIEEISSTLSIARHCRRRHFHFTPPPPRFADFASFDFTPLIRFSVFFIGHYAIADTLIIADIFADFHFIIFSHCQYPHFAGIASRH